MNLNNITISQNTLSPLKGLFALFQVTLNVKMAIPESQRYPWNLSLNNNVGFLTLNCLILIISAVEMRNSPLLRNYIEN